MAQVNVVPNSNGYQFSLPLRERLPFPAPAPSTLSPAAGHGGQVIQGELLPRCLLLLALLRSLHDHREHGANGISTLKDRDCLAFLPRNGDCSGASTFFPWQRIGRHQHLGHGVGPHVPGAVGQEEGVLTVIVRQMEVNLSNAPVAPPGTFVSRSTQ